MHLSIFMKASISGFCWLGMRVTRRFSQSRSGTGAAADTFGLRDRAEYVWMAVLLRVCSAYLPRVKIGCYAFWVLAE
jgi:hypothetical protein